MGCGVAFPQRPLAAIAHHSHEESPPPVDTAAGIGIRAHSEGAAIADR